MTEPELTIPLSINEEADHLISGPRRDSYGPIESSAREVADGWAIILNHPVTPRQWALMMVWLKVCRDNHRHARDNLVDIAGYAGLADLLG